MARGRLVSKSLGSSRKFHALLGAGGKLGEFCQVLFPLIVANTDDFGRMPGDAFTVKNVVLPSSPRPEKDFEAALRVIADVGLVRRYEAEGAIYLQVDKFDEHQPGLHKRTRSKFPEPTEIPGTSEIYRANLTQNLTQNPEENPEPNPEPGTALARRVADDLFEQFWLAYPKKKSKEDARRAWSKRRPDAALLEVMLRAIAIQRESPDWLKNSGQFIPHPASWLNGARWTDVVEVDIGPDGLSETARYNLAASEEMQRILLENETRRGGREH
jgi:hypothetical protein